jgi:hypothetical protein
MDGVTGSPWDSYIISLSLEALIMVYCLKQFVDKMSPVEIGDA